MNKSRRMAALQARKLAALGYGVLLVDLFGTGDSAGDFGEACLEIWRADLRRAAHWLQQQGAQRLIFWGLRFGTLLALDLAKEFTPQLSRIVLWQPIAKGEQFMTQFLRLRLAADLTGPGEKVTTQNLRDKLYAGEALEIAGYALSSALVRSIDALDLKNLATPDLPLIEWLEVVPDAQRPLTPVSRALVEAWRVAEIGVHVTTVAGESFWSTPEIAIAPALLERTAQILTEHVP